jgi:hypothetical protein
LYFAYAFTKMQNTNRKQIDQRSNVTYNTKIQRRI